MKRVLIICLMLAVAVAFGCGEKKGEESKDFREQAKRVSGGSLVDPVDKQPVDIATCQYSYVYKDIEYNFNSKENMDAFIKDPERYLED